MARRVHASDGDVFGRLTIVRSNFKIGADYYHFCRCQCGVEKNFSRSNVELGKSKSCGCLSRETPGKSRTHGMSKTAEYQVWNRMWNRCTNPIVERYPNYGGRGISVCSRWRNFINFFEDMGAKPGPEYSIGRIDNDAGYSKENCRWETPKQQASNTSRTVFMETGNGRVSVIELSEKMTVSIDSLRQRVRSGMSAERCLADENLNQKYITVDGEKRLTTEWMKLLPIPISSFYHHKRKGLSPEQIVSMYKSKN